MPHLHEKIDWTVDAFIVYQDTVLLRKHDKYKLWLAPGGHIELDEDPTQAVVREVREEVGLEVTLVGEVANISEGNSYKELLPPRFMNIHPIGDSHKHIGLVYFAHTSTNTVLQGESEISDEIRWFTAHELDDPSYGISETIRHYAHAALIACAL